MIGSSCCTVLPDKEEGDLCLVEREEQDDWFMFVDAGVLEEGLVKNGNAEEEEEDEELGKAEGAEEEIFCPCELRVEQGGGVCLDKDSSLVNSL